MSQYKVLSLVTPDGRTNQHRSMFDLTKQFTFTDPDNRYLKIATAAVGSAQLSQVSSSGHKVDLVENTHFSFLVPRTGALDVTLPSGKLAAKAGESLLFSPNERSTVVLRESGRLFQASAVLVNLGDADCLAEREDLSHPNEPVDCRYTFRALPEERSLRNYLNYLEKELSQSKSLLQHESVRKSAAAFFQECVLQLLIASQKSLTPLPQGGGLAKAYVMRAEELMLSRLGEPIAIPEIAKELGVGVRRLQLAFQKVRSMSPRAVLNRFRLEAARKLLADPPDTYRVGEIAMACGFTHLGRFAEAYKEIYGELPSLTYARSIKGRLRPDDHRLDLSPTMVC